MNNRKVAVITGSRRGIGLGIATELAREGYDIVLSGTASREQSVQCINDIKSLGVDVHYIKCDISKSEDRTRFFSEIMDVFGRIDVMVNNAGVAPKERMDILLTNEENFDYVTDVNLKGTFFMCQLAANTMISLKKELGDDYLPKIVNISSISAYTSSTNRAEYCISKAGISMSTMLFADKLANYGIAVFEVRPGIILTDMTENVKDAYAQKIENGLTPIKRFGTPKDVANCVVAAASGRLDFATGQVINADGGFHLRRL